MKIKAAVYQTGVFSMLSALINTIKCVTNNRQKSESPLAEKRFSVEAISRIIGTVHYRIRLRRVTNESKRESSEKLKQDRWVWVWHPVLLQMSCLFETVFCIDQGTQRKGIWSQEAQCSYYGTCGYLKLPGGHTCYFQHYRMQKKIK